MEGHTLEACHGRKKIWKGWWREGEDVGVKEEREGREVPNFNPRERKKKDYEDIFGSKTYKYPFPWNYHYALALNVFKSDTDT
jgi:hypothetical protein